MKNNSRINTARRCCCRHHRCHLLALFAVYCLATVVSRTVVHSFVFDIHSRSSHQRTSRQTAAASAASSSSALSMGYDQRSSSGSTTKRSNNLDRTKRQERVGHVVRTELATLLHRGVGIATSATGGGGMISSDAENDGIGEELRRRINIVHANVSPDLRQARVTISVLSTATAATNTVGRESSSSSSTTTAASGVPSTSERQRIRKANDVISRRRAYAWLVSNTKSIRHALSKRMSHMKGGAPELTFVQVDVGGAVDVMNLIDKVSNRNYKREEENFDDMLLRSMSHDDNDEDDDYEEGEDDDNDGWVDDDDDEEEDDEDYDDDDDDDDDDDYDDNEDDNAISMNNKGGKIVEDVVETIEMEEMDDDWVDFDDVEEEEEEEEEIEEMK